MMRILLVEDDSWQAEHLERQLKQAGYHVDVASHALGAISFIDTQPPDMVLLDMFLPGANAITLLHEMRSHADLAGIPVVMCSTENFDIATLRPYGVVDVLDKTTMTTEQLLATVRRVTS